jgi:hypothetical protein
MLPYFWNITPTVTIRQMLGILNFTTHSISKSCGLQGRPGWECCVGRYRGASIMFHSRCPRSALGCNHNQVDNRQERGTRATPAGRGGQSRWSTARGRQSTLSCATTSHVHPSQSPRPFACCSQPPWSSPRCTRIHWGTRQSRTAGGTCSWGDCAPPRPTPLCCYLWRIPVAVKEEI